MEDYRYSMKCDDDDEDEAEVFDQEGSLYIPNPIGDIFKNFFILVVRLVIYTKP